MRKGKVTPRKMVVVLWRDSSSCQGWQDSRAPFPEVAYCESAGYLVEKTDEAICIAQSRGVSDGISPWADLITIPTSAVVSVHNLKVVPK